MRSIKEIFRSHAVLDGEGVHVNGTDKESNHHYGDAYESLFTLRGVDNALLLEYPTNAPPGYGDTSTRCDVKLVMEVGVADGSCLRAWREVFPNALIVGMDIHHSDKAHGDRIEFHIGDMRSRRDCENAAAGRLFDMIVDDATHHIDANLMTLLYLWPFVRPGGMYVIEEFCDVHDLGKNLKALCPYVEIVDTPGPFGGNEPLVVLRKPS